MKDEARDAILIGNAGAQVCRRARKTGFLVTLYKSAPAGLDGGPWATVCEEHSEIATHGSRALALRQLSYPDDWCSVCAKAAQEDGESDG